MTINDALKKGIEAHKAGKFQEADRLYTAILRVQPKHPDANHNLGIIAVGVGKIVQALPLFKKALKANPSVAQFWLSYIDALIKLGKTSDAIHALKKAKVRGVEGDAFDQLERQLNELNLRNIKGATKDALQPIINLYDQGQFQEVLEQVTYLLQEFPHSLALYNIKGAAHLGLGEFDEALDSYKNTLKIKPDYAEAYYNMGVVLKEQGASGAAIDSYKQALKINPDYTEAYFNMGNALKEQGDFEGAIGSYTHLIKIKPDYAEAHNNLGNVLKEQGCFETAIESYGKALKINPDYTEAYFNMGNALKEQGDFEAAIDSYQQVININPDYAEAYNNMGNALKAQGAFEASIDSYKQVIKINPGYFEAYFNMGNALKAQGAFSVAVDSYVQAIKINPDYPEAYNNMGVALKEQGAFEGAIDCYKQVIKIKPDYAEAYFNLCEIYEKQNASAQLKAILYKAKKALPQNDTELQFHLAQLANREKRFEEARELLEFISPEKLSVNVRVNHSKLLGEIYDKLGMFLSAFEQFKITNEIVAQSPQARQINSYSYIKKVSLCSKCWANTENIKWPEMQTSSKRHSLVFLVGFPRSGTTLLDTILRSHPAISVVEEKPMLAMIVRQFKEFSTPEFLSHLRNDQVKKFQEVYYNELYTHVKIDDSCKVVIDKLPLNIVHVGLLHRIFPDSTFLVAIRHPIDCVLSCFMQTFKLNDAVSNFLTLHQSAKLYDVVMKLWERYNKALDLRFHMLKYENLIDDLQGTLEPLLAFLGLSWHNNLLNYRQTALSREMINTPSYNQVTQSLYKHAIGRWKNYETQLQEILPLLNPWVTKFGYLD